MNRLGIGKKLSWMAGGFLLTGLIVPFFHADSYRNRIRTALESALARKVSIGEVRFHLLTGFSFTVNDVVIEDDPSLSAEPLAYVTELEATPRLLSLFTGHLAFSSLKLNDAQLNLTRSEAKGGEYRWNFQPLLRPNIIAIFPSVKLRGSRINFKAGTVKSTVYLLNTDLDIDPPHSAGDRWQFRFQGEPARADRPKRSSGSLRANGTWKPGLLDGDLELEKSELGDIIALLRGEDIGVHGLLSGKARLHGPPDHVAINGRLRVEELHGWDQSIPKGDSWPLNLQGSWNIPGQSLEMDGRLAGQTSPILDVHYQVKQYLSQPRWSMNASAESLPLEPLVAIAHHLGVSVPDGLRISGTLAGGIGLSKEKEWTGQMAVKEAEMNLPGSPPLEMKSAEIVVENGHVRLPAVRVESADGEQADLQADYDLHTADAMFQITAQKLSIATLGKQTSLVAVPLLSHLSSGTWSGTLRYGASASQKPMWSGDVQLSSARVNFPGFSRPVLLESATGHLEDAQVTLQHMRGRSGNIVWQGDYRYEPAGTRPHHLRLAIGEASASALENLLLPALQHSNGLLGLPLDFGRRATPKWMAEWSMEGTVTVGTLTTGDVQLENVRTRFVWDGTHLLLPNLTARLGPGVVTSRVEAELAGNVPVYQAVSHIAGLPWKGGKVDADATVNTRGIGEDVLKNLRSSGTFDGHSLAEDVEEAAGHFEFAWKFPEPRLVFSELRLSSGEENFTGKGSLQEDGTLMLLLSTGSRQTRIAGTLAGEGSLHWLQ